jgi:hypothetical protein
MVRRWAALLVVGGALGAGANAAPASAYYYPGLLGPYANDGSWVLFQSDERLVAADQDGSQDVYERSAGKTKLISRGPLGANGPQDTGFFLASTDGTRVLFETGERLVRSDLDHSQDIYLRSAGTTRLISRGPAGGNGPFGSTLFRTSATARRVYFDTAEQLTGDDNDHAEDVYQRADGVTTLVSKGPAGGSGAKAFFAGAAAGHVFFETKGALVSADTDEYRDVYERFGNATRLVSQGPAGGNGARAAHFLRASSDGTRVLFATDEPLVGSDLNTATDIYERIGGSTTLISQNELGTATGGEFDGASTDGSRVLFRTGSPATGDDTDTALDVFERSGGTTTRISQGPIGGNGPFDVLGAHPSRDGSHVFFDTREPLVTADTDSQDDIYERSGGTTSLSSQGPAGGNGPYDVFDFAFPYRPSADGTHLIFATEERLVGADTDSSDDVYDRSGGTTTLISRGPAGGNGSFDVVRGFPTADGGGIFFETDEPLVVADRDTSTDLYERSGGQTTLISRR